MNKFDIVIPCHPKDYLNLTQTIKSLRNLSQKNNVYIISPSEIDIQLEDKFNHINDDVFKDMFSIEQIKNIWMTKDLKFAYRASWIYQQLIKLFAFKVIPELTEAFLFLDSDTMFLRNVNFDINKFQYSIPTENHIEYKISYEKMTGMKAEPLFSFICHHMLFKKTYLNELINHIENLHQNNFVDVLLNSINYSTQSPFAEQELYGNWVYSKYPNICERRQLKCENISYIPNDQQMQELGKHFDMVSSHAWIRGIEAR